MRSRAPASQRTKNGSGNHPARRLHGGQRNCAAERDRRREPHCRDKSPQDPFARSRATSPEVTHSSKSSPRDQHAPKCLADCVRLRKASFGRNAKVSPIWPSVAFRADAGIPRKCIRHGNCSGLRKSSTTSESKPGSSDDREDEHVASNAELRNEQPAAEQKEHERDRNQAAAKIVENFPPRQSRRADCGCRRPSASGTRGSSHGEICQSPRIQRCRRSASMS